MVTSNARARDRSRKSRRPERVSEGLPRRRAPLLVSRLASTRVTASTRRGGWRLPPIVDDTAEDPRPPWPREGRRLPTDRGAFCRSRTLVTTRRDCSLRACETDSLSRRPALSCVGIAPESRAFCSASTAPDPDGSSTGLRLGAGRTMGDFSPREGLSPPAAARCVRDW